MCWIKWLIIAICVLAAGCGSNNDELAADYSASLDVASVQTRVTERATTPSPLPSSSVEPRFQTATEIIKQATIWLQTHTSDPPTQTPLPRTPAPRPTLDPRTSTAGAATINSHIATLTEVVRQVTLTAAANMPPTRTPDPTLSPQEMDTLGDQWLSELEAAVGFSHPALAEHIDWLVEQAKYMSRFSQRPQPTKDTSLDIVIETTDYHGSTYMAVIATYQFPSFGNRLLIFRIGDGTPTLIHSIHGDEQGGVILGLDSQVELDRTLGGFEDRNGNGFPDLALSSDTMGSSNWNHFIFLLEIRPGDKVIDITPQMDIHPPIDGSKVVHLIDLNDDGILEVEARGCVEYPLNYDRLCKGLDARFYYAWDGTAYRDITTTLDITHWPATMAYWEYADQQVGCLVPTVEMYKMLIDYIARDKLEEGWALLEPRLCTPEADGQGKERLDELREWVAQQLADSD